MDTDNSSPRGLWNEMGPGPRVLGGIALALTLAPAGCALPPGDQDPTPRLPNIVLIYADDMGYGDLAIQNPESRIPTPNLDRLASEGMCFTDAHSSSGICTPSRYALLTGRYHWREFHGIVNVFEGSVIAPERLTLPEMLKQQGYVTGCIGKWHLGWDWDAIRRPESPGTKLGASPEEFDWSLAIPDGPLDHGFDSYFGDDVPNFPPYTWFRDEHVLAAPTVAFAPDPVPAEGAAEGRAGPMVEGWKLDAVMPRLTEEVVDWIHGQSGGEAPFFLYFPWTSPHAPIVPTEEWKGRSAAGPYGDFVAQSDATLGRVLEALEAAGVADDTLVIFTSDNGPEHYAYPRVRNTGHRSMGPLRGLKRDIWEGGHRIPFLARWPGVVAEGTVCEALVSQVDVMATIATAVGFELPDDSAEDSHDLTPLLKGVLDTTIRDSLVHNTRKDHYAIRVGDWVLIDAKSGGISRVPGWFAEASGHVPNPHEAALFNLREDLGQLENLFSENPDRVAQMRSLLQRIREEGHSAPRLAD